MILEKHNREKHGRQKVVKYRWLLDRLVGCGLHTMDHAPDYNQIARPTDMISANYWLLLL